MHKILSLVVGEIRELSKKEKELVNSSNDGVERNYQYVVLSEFKYKYEDDSGRYEIKIPKGFLTDGASGGPDYGYSWLFHDWLYASHCFSNDRECKREQADQVMKLILQNDRMTWYCWLFNLLSSWNIFCLFSKAWDSSGKRGPEFLNV